MPQRLKDGDDGDVSRYWTGARRIQYRLRTNSGDQVADVVEEVDKALAVGDRLPVAERLPQQDGRPVPDGPGQPRHGHAEHGHVRAHLESVLDRPSYAPVPINVQRRFCRATANDLSIQFHRHNRHHSRHNSD